MCKRELFVNINTLADLNKHMADPAFKDARYLGNVRITYKYITDAQLEALFKGVQRVKSLNIQGGFWSLTRIYLADLEAISNDFNIPSFTTNHRRTLSVVAAPKLTTVGGSMIWSSCCYHTYFTAVIFLPCLESVGYDLIFTLGAGGARLHELVLPRLRSVGRRLKLENWKALSRLALPLLQHVGDKITLDRLPRLSDMCEVGVSPQAIKGKLLFEGGTPRLVNGGYGDQALMHAAGATNVQQCNQRKLSVHVTSDEEYTAHMKDAAITKATELGRVYIAHANITDAQLAALLKGKVRVSSLLLHACTSLTDIRVDDLEVVTQDLVVSDMPASLKSVAFPKLVSVGNIGLLGLVGMVELALPRLSRVEEGANFYHVDSLRELLMPVLASVKKEFYLNGGESITRLALPVLSSADSFQLLWARKLFDLCEVGLTKNGTSGTVGTYQLGKPMRGHADLWADSKVLPCLSVGIDSLMAHVNHMTDPAFKDARYLGDVKITYGGITDVQLEALFGGVQRVKSLYIAGKFGKGLTRIYFADLEAITNDYQIRWSSSISETQLSVIAAPKLTTVGGSIDWYQSHHISYFASAIAFPSLTMVGQDLSLHLGVGGTRLHELVLPRLRSVGRRLKLENWKALSRLALPLLQHVGDKITLDRLPRLSDMCEVGVSPQAIKGKLLFEGGTPRLVNGGYGDQALMHAAGATNVQQCNQRKLSVHVTSDEEYTAHMKDAAITKATELGRVYIAHANITDAQLAALLKGKVRVSSLLLHACTSLTDIRVDDLEVVTQDLVVSDMPASLKSVAFPKLVSVGNIGLLGLVGMVELALPRLSRVEEGANFYHVDSLRELLMPVLASVKKEFYLNGGESITRLALPVLSSACSFQLLWARKLFDLCEVGLTKNGTSGKVGTYSLGNHTMCVAMRIFGQTQRCCRALPPPPSPPQLMHRPSCQPPQQPPPPTPPPPPPPTPPPPPPPPLSYPLQTLPHHQLQQQQQRPPQPQPPPQPEIPDGPSAPSLRATRIARMATKLLATRSTGLCRTRQPRTTRAARASKTIMSASAPPSLQT